ncbi:MAG: S-methyl-5-thioribose-1-phosphate isomerase [Acidobacteriota bacterium]|nr:S-methyl-5-thioribose-1-phosphate isomerase [Acidobacteriota bacterium]
MVDIIAWKGDRLELIDQRYLPFETKYFICRDAEETAFAVKNMVVRGAPAIGVTAAYGLALAVRKNPSSSAFKKACDVLAASRPTAINLFDAIDHMKTHLGDPGSISDPFEKAEAIAKAYDLDDQGKNKAIGKHGASILPGNRKVLTHCNTGSLATSGWGTALGVIRQLNEEKRLDMVYADETRPFLQGARLTVWECRQDNLPVTLVTDGMGGHLMTHELVDCVIVGSDRIAANGDVANKIGTFMLAMAANYHNIPFIVAAPTTTIALGTPTGRDIPIEQRPGDEITHVRGQRITQEGTAVFNPAFDVTPAKLVSAIVTEEGVFRYPYDFSKQ